MAEFDFIHWLKSKEKPHPLVSMGIGDDAALLRSPNSLLVTTDMLMDGVDFIREETTPERIGRKAMAVNLSDIAAMAGKPLAAFVSLALPHSLSMDYAKRLYDGIGHWCKNWNIALAGGDTNSWNGKLVISITVLGEPGRAGAVYRHGGQPEDWLFVTGPLGGSILGHHFDFTPRIDTALALSERVKLKAMLDISDGFSADLYHLCEASHCGAIIHADALPISDAARKSANSGKTALEHALGDGEDFELLFAVSPSDGQRLIQEQPLLPDACKLYRIGTLTQDLRILIEKAGQTSVLPRAGFVHNFGP